MGFTINIAKGKKKPKAKSSPVKISRLCKGVVIKEDDTYKVRISLNNDADNPDYLVIPFTKESLDLKGKVEVFSTKRDEFGKYIKFIRDSRWCQYNPGLPTQYTVVIEKLIVTGNVVRCNGHHEFLLKDTHGFGNATYNLPKLDESKPLFNNGNIDK